MTPWTGYTSLGNEIIEPHHPTGSATGCVAETERLGGLLRHYYRAAA